MVLTPDSYRVACGCGRRHPVLVKRVVIEPGAMQRFEQERQAAALPADYCAVYDQNTWQATRGRHLPAPYKVILEPEGLHANEAGVQQLRRQLPETAMLVAVGSGTLHDITRYCAAQGGLAFASVPTACSVDGFASQTASMTLKGMKVTVPALAPALIVADTDILAAAPWRLTCSGVGDIIGKYIALADWKISHLLTGEYYCEGIEALTRAAVQQVVACCPQLKAGERAAYGQLMKALAFSGVAMQLAGVSRPAAGAEHYLSHTLELGLGWVGPLDALHGEKVGVGAVLCAAEYHKWGGLSAPQIAERLGPLRTPEKQELEAVFGPLTGEVVKENQPDCLAAVQPERVVESWEEIRAIIGEIPPADEIEGLLRALGGKVDLPALGVPRQLKEKLLHWSAYVRNRVTFMRLARFMLR